MFWTMGNPGKLWVYFLCAFFLYVFFVVPFLDMLILCCQIWRYRDVRMSDLVIGFGDVWMSGFGDIDVF